MFRLRPDVARYTNTLARKNTDGKLKKKQKNLKKNSTETNSNSKPEDKGNSREEKINEVESQVRMGWVYHKYSQNLFHRDIFRKSFTILFLSANFSETIFRSFNFDKPKRLFIDILDSFALTRGPRTWNHNPDLTILFLESST